MGKHRQAAGGGRMGIWVALLALVLPCQGGWILDGMPSQWEGDAEAAVADEESYPVLRLELGGQWTDFELKASTNNFASLVYYVMSSGTNAYTTDTNVWVYFTDDYGADVRQWHRSAPGRAIWSQVADPTNSEVEAVIVCPSHECAGDWAGWMSRANDRLVWSFARYDGIGLEMNATGTKSHWTATVPVEWRKGRVAP